MSYNQLHNITVFFNLVSLSALHIGVFSFSFSNAKFKTQAAKVILQFPFI